MNQTMKNLNRFLMLAAALWITAGTAHAVERVVNGSFTANAANFKNTDATYGFVYCGAPGNPTSTGGVGTDTKGIKSWSMAGLGAGTNYFGSGGAATGLANKNYWGPTDCGNRTYALVENTAVASHLYQTITTLPVGFYKIQYDVACQKNYSANYNVVLTNSTATDNIYISGQNAASNSAFVTVTDYFGCAVSTARTIYLQNLTAGIYVCFANVSIQDALPPAPTVSNNTPINQGETVTLTASSPYTTTPTAFNWSGPAGSFSGNNVSFPNALPGWSGTYTCTVTVNGVTSLAAFTTVTVNASTSAITASSGANGTVGPDGVTNVSSGGSQTYTITAATGYHVADVLVDGSSVGAVTSYTFSSVTATHTISATFAINTYNITSSAGDNGSISPNGSTSVNYNGSQDYTITPDTGYHVADVQVDGGSVGAVTSYPFTSVTAAHTIAASFAINTYNITSSAGDNGSISPNGSTSVNYNGSQTYTITPDTGYHVADVLVDGGSVGAVTSYPFNIVTATHTIVASFAINTYNITSSAGDNGSISPDGSTSVNYNGSQTYTIAPSSSNYVIQDVLVDGTSNPGAVAAGSHTFTNVTANHAITATFAPVSTTITVTQTDHGTISPGTTTPPYGDNQTFNIAPETGYVLATLTVDGRSEEDLVTNYTFINVTEPHTITATFAINTYNITSSAGDNGSISPNGSTSVNYNGSLTYTITPSSSNYVIQDVLVDGTSNPGAVAAGSYTFTNVTATHTITATFHTLYQAWIIDNHYPPSTDASLLHYAFGTTNTGAITVIDEIHITLGQAPAMQITDGVVSAVFGRRTNDEGLTYTVEFCDDLGTWHPSTDTEHLQYDGPVTNPVVIAHEDDMDAVKVLFPTSIKVGTEYVKMAKTFLRIVVTTN